MLATACERPRARSTPACRMACDKGRRNLFDRINLITPRAARLSA